MRVHGAESLLAGAQLGLGGGAQLQQARHEQQVHVVAGGALRRHHRFQLPHHLQ